MLSISDRPPNLPRVTDPIPHCSTGLPRCVCVCVCELLHKCSRPSFPYPPPSPKLSLNQYVYEISCWAVPRQEVSSSSHSATSTLKKLRKKKKSPRPPLASLRFRECKTSLSTARAENVAILRLALCPPLPCCFTFWC